MKNDMAIDYLISLLIRHLLDENSSYTIKFSCIKCRIFCILGVTMRAQILIFSVCVKFANKQATKDQSHSYKM